MKDFKVESSKMEGLRVDRFQKSRIKKVLKLRFSGFEGVRVRGYKGSRNKGDSEI